MAVLATTHPTLLDLAKRMDPDGTIADVVELLNLDNPILEDMVWVEGNLPTGHRTTVRTGIPAPTWRKINGGVLPKKSTTAQITANTGMLEAYAEVDKALADLNGNTAAWRLSEEKAFIEGMNEEMARALIYESEANRPEAITGLAPYYSSLSAENRDYIIDAGGSGTDNASIWLVVWGPDTIHGIVPKGSKAGLQVTDKGQVTLESAPDGGGRMEAYRTHYRWDAGLVVRDYRYAVRIANIDKSNLTPDAATGAVLPDLMFQALEQVKSLNGRAVFYAPRGVITKIRQQSAKLTKNSSLTISDVGGKKLTDFNGVPIKRLDALAPDEARVV